MKKASFRIVFSLLTILAMVNVYAQESKEQEGLWIDVRTVEEFNRGHIEGALNIPHGDIAHKISAIATDLEQPIHLYCQSGVRSGLALEILMEMGYQNVVNEGGYPALVAKQQAQQ
ncbi:MAG: rhodanese-like domain-containing protein [Pseudohongiellaceae bacterium]